MALPLSLKPGSTRGVGTLQDPRIHGAARVPTTRRGTKENQTQNRQQNTTWPTILTLKRETKRGRPRNLHLPQTRWASLRLRKEIICVPRVHQRLLKPTRTGPRRNRRKTTDTAHIMAFRFYQPPQQARKKRMESHTNQLYNGSTRLSTFKSISNQTGNTWSEEQKHEGSHPEQDSPKNPLHV